MEQLVGNENMAIGNNLTEEHAKEGISKAYVQAITHCAGLNFSEDKYDYGIDGAFVGIKKRKDGRRYSNSFRLEFQLKASINIEIIEDEVKYSLEAKNYNDLVDNEVCTPRILIIYKLPKDKNEWIKVSPEGTIFKDCAWWCYLGGKPQTSNKETVTIKIPKDQIFNQYSLKKLMEQVEKGGLV